MNDRTSSSVHGVTLRGRSLGPRTPSAGFHAIFRFCTASVNARRRTVSIIWSDRGPSAGTDDGPRPPSDPFRAIPGGHDDRRPSEPDRLGGDGTS